MVNPFEYFDASTSSVWDYCQFPMALQPRLKYNNRYYAVYKAFCVWLDDKLVHQPIVEDVDIVDDGVDRINSRRTRTDGTVFITQNNVDVYFSTVLAHVETMSLAVIKMKCLALTWWLKLVEQRGADSIAFSDRINHAISDQQILNLEYTSTAFASCDPHKGLKDTSLPKGNQSC